MKRNTLAGLALSLGLVVAFWAPAHAAGPTIIEFTQTPCQFLESEGGTDHGYKSAKKADCEAINKRTGADRLAAAEPMTLKPGKYVFRVTNRNVPYGLGFWLRGDGIVSRATLPSVSGGGLTQGTTKDYEIELKPGAYVYSCPLNPTPDYKLVVEE
jgi:hypothetical protein